MCGGSRRWFLTSEKLGKNRTEMLLALGDKYTSNPQKARIFTSKRNALEHAKTVVNRRGHGLMKASCLAVTGGINGCTRLYQGDQKDWSDFFHNTMFGPAV